MKHIIWIILLLFTLASCSAGKLEDQVVNDPTALVATGAAASETGAAVVETAVVVGGTVVVNELTPEPGGNNAGTSQVPGIPQPIAGLVSEIVLDLADRLGVEATNIRFVDSEEVQWPDTSLGCPQPDEAYLDVITPGFKIILEVDGKQYEYHTDLRGNFAFCGGV